MKKYPTQTPYIASYIVLKNNEGKIAFVLRSNTSWMNGYYGLPSGKVEEGESFTHAAMREAKEEVGIDVSMENIRHVHTVHRKAELNWVDVYFEVLEYSGEPINAEPHMHSELAWLDPNDLPDNVLPDVVSALKNIKKQEPYSEFGW